MNARALATQIIFDVVQDGYSLSDALATLASSTKVSDVRDKGFIQAVSYGVCRWYFRLDALAKLLLQKPLKAKDQDIYILILVGLYQLIDMRIPDYAAVGETVAATKALKKEWAKNLVNGVLRQYQRVADELNAKIKSNLVAEYSHPLWMIEKIKHAWPENWQAILATNNQHPPFTLRVNQKFNSRAAYLATLSEDKKVVIIPETQAGFVLVDPIDVYELPGFNAGHLSVQDAAAQLAAEQLMLEPNQRVLDACAAPGGKTAHILEMQPDLAELVAVDHDQRRLEALSENLRRLTLSAHCIAADIGELKSWWDEKLFDRILLDVPCSASGVIRRHPDIKLLRRASDIKKLVAEQERLLTNVWPTLKPGGLLLYVTCSLFPEENELLVQTFLTQHPDAVEEKLAVSWGLARTVGRQILPGMHEMDGFYYARLRKCAELV